MTWRSGYQPRPITFEQWMQINANKYRHHIAPKAITNGRPRAPHIYCTDDSDRLQGNGTIKIARRLEAWWCRFDRRSVAPAKPGLGKPEQCQLDARAIASADQIILWTAPRRDCGQPQAPTSQPIGGWSSRRSACQRPPFGLDSIDRSQWWNLDWPR